MPEEQDVKQDLRFVVSDDPPTVQSPRAEHDREALRIRYERSIDSCLKSGHSAEAELLSKALVDLHEDNDFSAEHAEALLQKIEASTKAAYVDLGAFQLASERRKRAARAGGMWVAAMLIISAALGVVLNSQRPQQAVSDSNSPSVSTQPAPTQTVPVGTPVSIDYRGEWWPAVVTAHDGHLTQIHYVGWDCSWDEWVTPDRMRALPQKDMDQIRSQAGSSKNLHEAYNQAAGIIHAAK